LSTNLYQRRSLPRTGNCVPGSDSLVKTRRRKRRRETSIRSLSEKLASATKLCADMEHEKLAEALPCTDQSSYSCSCLQALQNYVLACSTKSLPMICHVRTNRLTCENAPRYLRGQAQMSQKS
jgi:hypothetical protein